MKPRLRVKDGVWSCITWPDGPMGFGYTAKEAYDDWRRRNVLSHPRSN
jgi:hypothetical protein